MHLEWHYNKGEWCAIFSYYSYRKLFEGMLVKREIAMTKSINLHDITFILHVDASNLEVVYALYSLWWLMKEQSIPKAWSSTRVLFVPKHCILNYIIQMHGDVKLFWHTQQRLYKFPKNKTNSEWTVSRILWLLKVVFFPQATIKK